MTARVPGCGCLAHWRPLREVVSHRSLAPEFWLGEEHYTILIEEIDISNQSIACNKKQSCPHVIAMPDRIMDNATIETFKLLDVMAALEMAHGWP